MARQHELLAAEKTVNSAWADLLGETLKKLKNPSTYFHGHSRFLAMLEESDKNRALEESERQEKPVTTNVYDTLSWALSIFQRAEQLQYQKNRTNQRAVGTVMWQGEPMLEDLPIDELMGLEKRLGQIRELFLAIPTLDASQHWKPAPKLGPYVWEVEFPIQKTKTDKVVTPVKLADATEHHPAQVHIEHRDLPIGKYTTIARSGEATAVQKAEAIKRLDDFVVEVKAARMRANATEVDAKDTFAEDLVSFLLEPLSN